MRCTNILSFVLPLSRLVSPCLVLSRLVHPSPLFSLAEEVAAAGAPLARLPAAARQHALARPAALPAARDAVRVRLGRADCRHASRCVRFAFCPSAFGSASIVSTTHPCPILPAAWCRSRRRSTVGPSAHSRRTSCPRLLRGVGWGAVGWGGGGIRWDGMGLGMRR